MAPGTGPTGAGAVREHPHLLGPRRWLRGLHPLAPGRSPRNDPLGWFLAINHPISVPTPLSSQEAVGRAERGRKAMQEGQQRWEVRWAEGGMEPRGVGTGWLCVAVLCSGAALVLKEKEPGHQSTTQRDDVLEPRGDPATTTESVDKLTTWPTATPTPTWTGGPGTTPVLTRAGAAGNKTQNAAAVPVRYWSPVIFVVVALLVLFFTYRRTKGEGTRDRAASASDSSDLGALVHLPTHDTAPIIPAPQGQRKGSANPPTLEHTETIICEPDPPPPQPDTPTTAAGPRCSAEPGAE
ncbi:uncharacterized protein LOC116963992 isoform X2 [Tyto alba]|uniref:uncharacterized protein LOC116963992 isoform X2 n=1 Tax=Tyto alba TaxID=56313 RepID=UPI001C67A1DB|nr:uncharacterized protein LOC116963992 isoform X2 [Tyto alba]